MCFVHLLWALLRAIQHPSNDVLERFKDERDQWHSLDVEWCDFISDVQSLAQRYLAGADRLFERRLIRVCLKHYPYQSALTTGENAFQLLLYIKISFRFSVEEETSWKESAWALQRYVHHLEERYESEELSDRKGANYSVDIFTHDRTLAERLLAYFPEDYGIFSEALCEWINVRHAVQGKPPATIDPATKWDISLGYTYAPHASGLTHTATTAYRLNYKSLITEDDLEEDETQATPYRVSLTITGGRYAWNKKLLQHWADWAHHIEGIAAIDVSAGFHNSHIREAFHFEQTLR